MNRSYGCKVTGLRTGAFGSGISGLRRKINLLGFNVHPDWDLAKTLFTGGAEAEERRRRSWRLETAGRRRGAVGRGGAARCRRLVVASSPGGGARGRAARSGRRGGDDGTVTARGGKGGGRLRGRWRRAGAREMGHGGRLWASRARPARGSGDRARANGRLPRGSGIFRPAAGGHVWPRGDDF